MWKYIILGVIARGFTILVFRPAETEGTSVGFIITMIIALCIAAYWIYKDIKAYRAKRKGADHDEGG